MILNDLELLDGVSIQDDPQVLRLLSMAARWSSDNYHNKAWRLLRTSNKAFEELECNPAGIRNEYFMLMGSQEVLADSGAEIHRLVAGMLKNDSRWTHQGREKDLRLWLELLLHSYFPSTIEPGWVSFISGRRPPSLRKGGWDGSTIIVPNGPPQPLPREPAGESIRLGHEVIPLTHIYLAGDGAAFSKYGYPAKIIVPRQVRSLPTGSGRSYHEERLCLAIEGESDSLLRQGIIPALAAYYTGQNAFQDTPILNLAKPFRSEPNGAVYHKNLGLELSPDGGAVASLRISRMPLDVSMMTCEPVEPRSLSQSLAQALRKLPSWTIR